MLDRDLHERASSLFLELRGLPPDQQRSRLQTRAGSDLRLHREVLSLLENDSADTAIGSSDHAAVTSAGPAPAGPAEDVPVWIGPYRVISRLGRGGSGLVLLAEQRQPVQRRVAVKLLPHAVTSPDHAARFEFERRALERTDHPNIARILDAGRTPDGLPFLVMDYVEGVSLTEYCRRHGLGLRQRIALVLDVADAVQHAHQRGVIHRDLKPGNILVSETNGRATPRVLDFGIAKPVAEALEIDAPPTIGLPLGTPAYMAPEQTGGQSIDTRADVYALGAVMYELTCGRPPVEARGDTLEVLRRIRETIPPPASRVRAEHADTIPVESVPRGLLADLDCVLAKALEKSPARRYPTIASLAEDLRRVLRRKPIEARPATLGYRAARFAQRNRALVASLAVVLAAILLGTAGLAAGLVEANRQRREATNQGNAQREINRFLTDDLLAAASPDQQGKDVTALDLLHRASRKVDQRFADQPLVAAAIHHTLGSAYVELGAYDDADRHLERAIALRRAGAGADAPDTVRSEAAAASLLGQRERLAEAQEALLRVMPRARQILGPDDPVLYTTLNDLGVVYETMDKGPEAVALLEESLAGRQRLLGPNDPQVLATMSNLAQGYDRLGQTDRSLGLLIEALRIADGLEEQPHMTVLGLCNNIGATYQDLNREREAEPYLRRAAELAGKWLGPENPATFSIEANLAGLEAKLGDPARAAELYDAVVNARTRLLGPDASDTLTARYGYWDALWLAKRFDEAAAGYAALLPDMARALGNEHWLAIQTRASLARALLDCGRAQEALPYAQEASTQFLALYGPEHARTRRAVALFNIINGRLSQGDGQPATTETQPSPQ